MINDFYEERVQVFLSEMKKYTAKSRHKITNFLYKYCGYKNGNALPYIDDSFSILGEKDFWGGEEALHAWFYKKLEIPTELVGKDLALSVTSYSGNSEILNPQFIAYVDGKLCHGVDVNHPDIYLFDAKKEHEIYLYAYTAKCESPIRMSFDLIEYDEDVIGLYYKIKVLYETSLCHTPVEKVYQDIKTHVTGAINLVDMRCGYCESFVDSIKEADKYLENEFFKKYAHHEKSSVITIGHTHIDVAYLWTLAQTREKVLRSFSTVISMMKKFPEYKFMSSQAQLYKYTKQECPELYEEIKQMIALGRWEVEGAMWVEADCNLSSGESLVRQILYGKKFFMDEFGVDCHLLWLPDVFGYSAALPQILIKSGVNKFVTSKISWNDSNMMPYDTFFWKGIDGSEVFTYFLTPQQNDRNNGPRNRTTYNAMLDPSYVAGTYDRYQQKDISDETMIAFGYGDGGGGPTEEHLRNYAVLKRGVPGISKTKMEFSGEFLERLRKKASKNKNTPKWHGELYLEFHRGTYTSMAKNKRYNRKSEFLFEKAETLSVMAEKLIKKEYPASELYDGWETIMLNQFHDILPGSSISEVYEDSHRQYEEISCSGNNICDDAKAHISKNISTDGGLLVFNPNSFETSAPVIVDGKTLFVEDIPAKGYRVVTKFNDKNTIKFGTNSMENKFYRLTFDKKGTLTSVFDKKNRRQVIKKGERGNRLVAYEDLPRKYDNWEISNYYREKSWEIDEVIFFEPINDGARGGFEITKKFLNSTITQRIFLYEDIDRIDFENDIDWKESHIIVKAEFPVNINSDRATYDIQFGTVERPAHTNNSWDEAKFEVCAHKFADYSEYGYGVSMLNGCKYGHDIHDGIMKLTLLKCGLYPNPQADKCHHEFTYSLVVHTDDFRKAGIIQKAYSLNVPLEAQWIGSNNGTLPDRYSLVNCKNDNIFIETIKKAENKDGYIIRLYDAFGTRSDVTLELGFDAKTAELCDLLERPQKKLKLFGTKLSFSCAPYEIITLRIK